MHPLKSLVTMMAFKHFPAEVRSDSNPGTFRDPGTFASHQSSSPLTQSLTLSLPADLHPGWRHGLRMRVHGRDDLALHSHRPGTGDMPVLPAAGWHCLRGLCLERLDPKGQLTQLHPAVPLFLQFAEL